MRTWAVIRHLRYVWHYYRMAKWKDELGHSDVALTDADRQFLDDVWDGRR